MIAGLDVQQDWAGEGVWMAWKHLGQADKGPVIMLGGFPRFMGGYPVINYLGLLPPLK